MQLQLWPGCNHNGPGSTRLTSQAHRQVLVAQGFAPGSELQRGAALKKAVKPGYGHDTDISLHTCIYIYIHFCK